MERLSFIFYKSFSDALRELPEDMRLHVYDAIIDYAIYGKEPTLTGAEKAMFLLIQPQINANNARYENGLKGGAKKKTEKQPNNNQTTTEKQPNNNQTTTKKQPNEKEKENENENERDSAHARVVVSSLSEFFVMDGDFSEQELETLQKLKPIVEKNDYLRSWRFASKYLAKAEKIFAGYYDKYKEDRHECKMTHGYQKHEYTAEQLNAIFYNVDGEQNE